MYICTFIDSMMTQMKRGLNGTAYLRLRRPARLIPGMSGGSGPGGVPLSWGSLKPAAEGCMSDHAPAQHETGGSLSHVGIPGVIRGLRRGGQMTSAKGLQTAAADGCISDHISVQCNEEECLAVASARPAARTMLC